MQKQGESQKTLNTQSISIDSDPVMTMSVDAFSYFSIFIASELDKDSASIVAP